MTSTSNLWTGPFPTEGVAGYFLLLPCFIEFPVFNTNSVDPDHAVPSAASDLGPHCLLMSTLRDTRRTWVKIEISMSDANFGPFKQSSQRLRSG